MISDCEMIFWYYPDPEEAVATATFTILEDAPEGTETALTFDGECCGLPPVENTVVFRGYSVTPGEEPSTVGITLAVNGRVKVVGEMSIFMRGDFNLDQRVNVADALAELQYLFKSGHRCPCPDAADANDDGRVDVADAVVILATLFTASPQIAPPYPVPGEDPTSDDLGLCYY